MFMAMRREGGNAVNECVILLNVYTPLGYLFFVVVDCGQGGIIVQTSPRVPLERELRTHLTSIVASNPGCQTQGKSRITSTHKFNDWWNGCLVSNLSLKCRPGAYLWVVGEREPTRFPIVQDLRRIVRQSYHVTESISQSGKKSFTGK